MFEKIKIFFCWLFKTAAYQTAESLKGTAINILREAQRRSEAGASFKEIEKGAEQIFKNRYPSEKVVVIKLAIRMAVEILKKSGEL
ncbi:MAG: hypothetical protein KGY70_19690 [Bacteroidales bacterium]|nr:hypothetical protein [Bacteroidales bacterium]